MTGIALLGFKIKFQKFFKTPLTNHKSGDIIKPTKSIGF